MTESKANVIRVSHEDLPKLKELWRQDASDDNKTDLQIQNEIDGLDSSLSTFDFLSSDSHWVLALEVDGQFIGYLTATRIHKADARKAVLYIDELMILKEHRRNGYASLLLDEASKIAAEIKAWRIRLLVDPANEGARSLYETNDFKEAGQVLCQKGV